MSVVSAGFKMFTIDLKYLYCCVGPNKYASRPQNKYILGPKDNGEKSDKANVDWIRL